MSEASKQSEAARYFRFVEDHVSVSRGNVYAFAGEIVTEVEGTAAKWPGLIVYQKKNGERNSCREDLLEPYVPPPQEEGEDVGPDPAPPPDPPPKPKTAPKRTPTRKSSPAKAATKPTPGDTGTLF